MIAPIAQSSPSSAPAVGPGKLWFGILAAPFAWATHVLVSYWLASFLCSVDPQHVVRVQVRALDWPFLLLTAAAAALAIAGARVALTNWRTTCSLPQESKLQPGMISAERSRFMAMCGLIDSAIFIVALVFSSVDLVIAPLCAK